MRSHQLALILALPVALLIGSCLLAPVLFGEEVGRAIVDGVLAGLMAGAGCPLGWAALWATIGG